MTDLYDPSYNNRQATYDLRRLRLKGLIERVPGSHTYRVTERGRAIATFLTRLASRVVVPVLTQLDVLPRPTSSTPTALITAWRAYDAELRKITKEFAAAA